MQQQAVIEDMTLVGCCEVDHEKRGAWLRPLVWK